MKFPFRFCTAIIFMFVFVGSSILAQNVSITDYREPVSSADRFLVDFSANHATKGSDVTTSKGSIGGIYKRFYDSQPFGYSFDFIGSSSVEKDIVADKYKNDYKWSGSGSFKKYIMEGKDLFGSVRLDASMLKPYDRPASAVTVGLGYGRFVSATPLAKAVRVEEFLIREGELKGNMPKADILSVSRIIARRREYMDMHGDTYKKFWYADMEDAMRKSGMLKGDAIGAVGVLRIDEVIERERMADRFYGWDATLGFKLDITLPYEGQDRPPVNLDFTANYARPISWKWQVNERFSMTTPLDNPVKSYFAALASDISYELSNRIDFRIRHLLNIDKVDEDANSEYSNSLGVSLVYYLENYISIVTTWQLEKVPANDVTTNFVISLNYRVF